LDGVVESSGCGHELTSSSVDGVSMELTINDVESHSSHVLVAEHTLFGCPLEGRDHGLFDFVHVLNSLGDVHNHVGALVVGTEAPDFGCFLLIPSELI
jgi:hypothetical protein